MKAKQIIKRNLDLSKSYTLVEYGYIPMEDGGAGYCMDCGKIIARYAIIKSDNDRYIVGLDCLKKLLKTSAIISDINLDNVENAELTINQFCKLIKQISETKELNKHLKFLGISPISDQWNPSGFHDESYMKKMYFSFYYYFEGCRPNNTNIYLSKETNKVLFLQLVEQNNLLVKI